MTLCVESVTSYRIYTEDQLVTIHGHDLSHIEGVLAYAAAVARHSRHVQGIKFIRAEFGLGLREAKAIYDQIRKDLGLFPSTVPAA